MDNETIAGKICITLYHFILILSDSITPTSLAYDANTNQTN